MSEDAEPDFLQPRVRVEGPIQLAEPDATWPGQYRSQEQRIRTALGSRALVVEHVGSTSVPGLAAKPIIDILLVVADSADEAGYVPELERAGFVLAIREPGWQEHRLLRGRGPEVNVHVFTSGADEIDRLLLFRERLRARPDERDLYEQRKRRLAAHRWTYVQDYADAKSTIVEEIIRRAAADGQG